MSLARTLVVLLFTASTAVAAGEAAEANIEILRNTIRSNKKALVAASLTLSDAEAEQFWPIYDKYQGELTAVNDKLVKVIEEYTAGFASLTDEKALDLMGRALAVDEDRTKVRRTYLVEFQRAIPGRKVARFYQIENKIDAIWRYDLAEEIPVVQDK